MPDHAVKVEALAAVLGISTDTLKRRLLCGEFPPADFKPYRRGAGWRLSTLRAWNPQVAAKIERGLLHEVFAFQTAA